MGARDQPLGAQAGEGAGRSTASPAQAPCGCPVSPPRPSSSAQLLAFPDSGSARSNGRPRPLRTGQVSANLVMFCCVAEGWEGLLRCWGRAGELCPRPQGAPNAAPYAHPCPLPRLPQVCGGGAAVPAASLGGGRCGGFVGRSAGGMGPCSCPLPAADHLSFN